ncbi:MAG: 4-(cytidine 5'-diphospho)-2-C-methyl-D-erythritol kinase [Halieaceae bacterium]|nr:4-(cytidine 5'-diphospho)-2-C-methyl-D-erythritol kinase [Halieaceae bacterium]
MRANMWLTSPAKLNLFLHITGRREDGYHTLQTIFQLLDYGDSLYFELRQQGGIEVICKGLDISPQSNLVYRAARLLQERCKVAQGIHIQVDKRIPVGAGLGGGSSNAAATLLALNQLWELRLDASQLAGLGLELGADVPVFVHGHSAWGEGVGEQLTPLQLPEQWYVVIAPSVEVSTTEVFSHQELTGDTAPIKMAAFFERGGVNDCQPVVRKLYPEVDKALVWLEKHGQARMTGTGGCVFLPLPDPAQAEAVLAQKPACWRGFLARGINRSPVLENLEKPA